MMKSLILILVLVFTCTSFQIQDQKNETQGQCMEHDGQWIGLQAYFVPYYELYCVYSLNYNALSTNEYLAMEGQTQLIYEVNNGDNNEECDQFIDKIHAKCENQGFITLNHLHKSTINIRDFYGQGVQSQLMFSKLLQTVDENYSMSFVKQGSYEAEIYQTFKEKLSEATCQGLQGIWVGKYLSIDDDYLNKYTSCLYDVEFNVMYRGDGLINITGYASNPIAANQNKEYQNTCYDLSINYQGYCNEDNQNILQMNNDEVNIVFSKDVLIIQSNYVQSTVVRD